MNYENVVDIFFSRFPDMRSLLSEFESESLPYIAFGGLMSHIIELIRNSGKNDEKIKLLFEFFEEMATCEISEVRELLMYAILEMLGDYKDVLKTADSYMGKETWKLSRAVEKFHGRAEFDIRDWETD